MKKILLFVIALACGLPVFGQDVIITKDAQRIEGFIINLTSTEVQYKVSVDSPVKVLSTAQINTILFQNGQVKVYNDNTPRQPQATAPAPQTQETTESQQPDVQAPVQTTIAPNAVTTYNIANQTSQPMYAYVSRYGNTYYYEGRSMDKDAYRRFLADKCPAAHAKMNTGYIVAYTGWCLFAVGLGMDLGYVIGTLSAGGTLQTTPISIVAGCCEWGSIPFLSAGYCQMHKSVDIFNAQCGVKAQCHPYWSVQTSPNGIGLALNF